GVPGREGAQRLGSQVIVLAPGASYDINEPFEVIPGNHTYSIEATSLGGAEISGQTTHITSATLVGEGQLAVESVELSDAEPYAGENVTVTAKIVNFSNQAVGPFSVAFYAGNPNFAPGLQPLATASVSGMAAAPADGVTSVFVTFQWKVPSVGGNFVVTVR